MVWVDVVGSVSLKQGEADASVQATFAAFHRWVDSHAGRNRGAPYLEAGDGALLRFTRAADAFAFGLGLVDSCDAFNHEHNELSGPVHIRVGMHTGAMPEVARSDRGKVTSSTIDIAAKLQEAARPGEILLSETTYAELSGVERLRPLRTPVAGVLAYAV